MSGCDSVAATCFGVPELRESARASGRQSPEPVEYEDSSTSRTPAGVAVAALRGMPRPPRALSRTAALEPPRNAPAAKNRGHCRVPLHTLYERDQRACEGCLAPFGATAPGYCHKLRRGGWPQGPWTTVRVVARNLATSHLWLYEWKACLDLVVRWRPCPLPPGTTPARSKELSATMSRKRFASLTGLVWRK